LVHGVSTYGEKTGTHGVTLYRKRYWLLVKPYIGIRVQKIPLIITDK